MHRPLKVSFVVMAGTLALAQAPQQRPMNIPFYTWVREDTFAGWMNDDLARHARGMKRTQEFLDEGLFTAEATNWLGTGKVFEATRAWDAGDAAKGDALFLEGMALMEKGVAQAPDHLGIRATTGGTIMNFARKLPDRHYNAAVEKARDHYAVLFKAQDAMLDKLPLHLKGEALAGAAETEFRVGDRAKGLALLNRIVTTMPGTAYAQTAEKWLKAPAAVTKQDRVVCQSCHEPGRIGAWMSRQPSAQ